ncbi:hypothetical protein ABB07_31485 [Streptomyces incarnatus]|uniref:Uncharacterized protein n=1 Tax=Streptomyces incarnatus TaxID=665007 RepID=A0ABN4GR85_9ACTN|nr:hypothetical protein [Streptomyces incarnatus]AKJ14414.1 hypothetical protein ABB07_31485 [Streptomyces incarnatus]
MNEWLIALSAALIGAGSALGGSVISARSTRAAGERQAEAALEALRLSAEEQRAARVHDQRRQAYVRFLDAVGAVTETRRTGAGRPDDRTDLQRALDVVQLEGPAEVAAAARALVDPVRRDARPDALDGAREAFLEAARRALH